MKRNYPLMSLIVVILIAAYSLDMNVLRDLLLTLLLAIICEFIHLYGVKPFIHIEMLVDKKQIEKGKIFEVQVEIKNDSFLPSPYIYIKMPQGERILGKQAALYGVLLGPKQKRKIKMSYEAKYIGYQNLLLEEVYLMDYFHLGKSRLKQSCESKVNIMPQIIKLANKQLLEETMTAFQKGSYYQKQFNTNIEGEVGYELEPYRPGESLSLIHWKLLVQKDHYLVRQREGGKQNGEKLTVILDPVTSEKASISRQDKLLTVMVSLLAMALNEGQYVDLILYGKKGWQQVSLTHMGQLKALFYEFSEYVFFEEGVIERLPIHLLEHLKVTQNLLFLTHHLDQSLLDNLGAYYAQGHKIHIMDTQVLKEEEEVAILKQKGLSAYMWQVSDKYEILYGVRR